MCPIGEYDCATGTVVVTGEHCGLCSLLCLEVCSQLSECEREGCDWGCGAELSSASESPEHEQLLRLHSTDALSLSPALLSPRPTAQISHWQ